MVLDSFTFEVIGDDAQAETSLLLGNWYGVHALFLKQYAGPLIAVSKSWYEVNAGYYSIMQDFDAVRLESVPDDADLEVFFNAGLLPGFYLGSFNTKGNWWAADQVPDFYSSMTDLDLLNYVRTAAVLNSVNVWPVKNEYYLWLEKVTAADRKGIFYQVDLSIPGGFTLSGGKHRESPEGTDTGVQINEVLEDNCLPELPSGFLSFMRQNGGSVVPGVEVYKEGVLLDNYELPRFYYVHAGVDEDAVIYSGGRPMEAFSFKSWLQAGATDSRPRVVTYKERALYSLLLNMQPVQENVSLVVEIRRQIEEDVTIVPAVYGPEVYIGIDIETLDPIYGPGPLLVPAQEVYEPLFFVKGGNDSPLRVTDIATVDGGYEALGLAAYDTEENPIQSWKFWLIGTGGRRISPIQQCVLDRSFSYSSNAAQLIYLNSVGGWSSTGMGFMVEKEVAVRSVVVEEIEVNSGTESSRKKEVVDGSRRWMLHLGGDAKDLERLGDLLFSEMVYMQEAGTEPRGVVVGTAAGSRQVGGEYVGSRVFEIIEK